MSVEIKSTLFSFITLRPPHLGTSKSYARLSVADSTAGNDDRAFKNLFNDPSLIPSLQYARAKEIAANFKGSGSGFIPHEAALKETVSTRFFDYSEWFGIHKEDVFKGNTAATAYANEFNTPLSEAIKQRLWDNLYFQLITSEDVYLGSTIMSLLIADKYVSEEGEEERHEVAKSSVVIAPEFFGKKGFVDTVPARRTLNNHEFIAYTQKIATINAEKSIEEYKLVQEKLLKWQKKYTKIEADRYKAARADYDSRVREVYDANKVLVPEKETASGTIIAEHYKLPITVTLPTFSYTPSVELNSDILREVLGEAQLSLIEPLGLDECDTISEALQIVNENLQQQTDILFKNTKFTEKVIMAGGSIIASDGDNLGKSGSYDFTFTLTRKQKDSDLFYASFSILDEDLADLKVQSISFTVYDCGLSSTASTSPIIYSSTDLDKTIYLKKGSGSIIYIYIESFSKENTYITLENNHKFGFKGKVSFENGSFVTFDEHDALKEIINTGSESTNFSHSGVWLKDSVIISSTTTGTTEGDTTTTPATEKPSGYGIRRLGIADYRRVEQKLCCYIPGEVSSIENIMAGEYKERSTRRLRRTEETIVTEKQTEQERLTDTTTTERFQMQQQSASVHNDNLAISAGGTASFKNSMGVITAYGNVASNTSKSESNSQAVSYGKDVTAKALERVVQKIKEERTIKIIEEFEEQNKHGLDNRGNNQHVSGVFRWIDAKYTNSIINYGKRMIYEFMIPQPAAFHNLAMSEINASSSLVILEKPIDPRKATDTSLALTNYTKITEATAAHWAGMYNVEIEPIPEPVITVSKSVVFSRKDTAGGGQDGVKTESLMIPEGYVAVNARITLNFMFQTHDMEWTSCMISVADQSICILSQPRILNYNYTFSFSNRISNELPIGILAVDFAGVTVGVAADCHRTNKIFIDWQLKTFNAIIEGYEKKLEEYNEKVAEAKAVSNNETNSTNPLFFRQIESAVLKKSCIHYLLDNNTTITLGSDFYTPTTGRTVKNLVPNNTKEFDVYAGYARFFEQAFEWNIMSYEYLPFYWGASADWSKMYKNDVTDPLFRSFLQAGMARTIVTVRPGYEKAVLYYMATGLIPQSSEIPVVEDKTYGAIVKDLLEQESEVEETWESVLPTTLTALQSGTIAIQADGLPCDCREDTGIVQNGKDKANGSDVVLTATKG